MAPRTRSAGPRRRRATVSTAWSTRPRSRSASTRTSCRPKTAIDEAIKAVNEAIKGEDAEDIRAKTERLQTAFHTVSEAMYERAQAAQAETSSNGASSDGDAPAEEEVVDAEVVDEQK